MNWLTNFVLPKIRAVVTKTDVPENLWQKCADCGQMLFRRDLEANLYVCSNCGSHLRVAPQQRLAMLFDEGTFSTIELPKPVAIALQVTET
jgi:acetyl-CoA carboxylase carboxyl transferase subunit beta